MIMNTGEGMKPDEGESPEAFRNRCLHQRAQHERMYGQFTGDTLCLDCGMLFTSHQELEAGRRAHAAGHYKHYLRKALEALKKCAGELDGEFPKSDDRHPDTSGLNKLIKELEEVRV